MLEKTKPKEQKKIERLAGALSTRGRIIQGIVTKKFEKRAVVELVRTVRIPKYERFTKKKTRLHARIPEKVVVHVGDIVKVRECRPLSKIIHFIVIEVVKGVKNE